MQSSASLTGFGVVVKLHSLHSLSPRYVSRHHDDQSSANGQPGSSSSSANPECSKSTSMQGRVRVLVIASER